MKYLLICLALLIFSSNAIAEVRPEYSGAWYNPAQSGHGFSIDVISPERSIAFWYAYDPWGNPIFLLVDGVNIGNQIQAQVYYFQGMKWGEFDPNSNGRLDWGTLTITFNDCGNATVDYESILEYPTGETFGSGQFPIVHLASIDGFRCSDYPMSGIYSGFAHSERYGHTTFGYGIVDEEGFLNFVSDEGVIVLGALEFDYYGQDTASAVGYSVYYEVGQSVTRGTFSANGHYSADTIALNFNSSVNGDFGKVEINKLHRTTSSAVSMSDIAGNWSGTNLFSGLSESFTIFSDGTFSVTDDYGCHFNGRIEIPNPELSILDVSVDVTNCSSASGTYIGTGAFLENEKIHNNGRNVIYLVGWNQNADAAVIKLIPN